MLWRALRQDDPPARRLARLRRPYWCDSPSPFRQRLPDCSPGRDRWCRVNQEVLRTRLLQACSPPELSLAPPSIRRPSPWAFAASPTAASVCPRGASAIAVPIGAHATLYWALLPHHWYPALRIFPSPPSPASRGLSCPPNSAPSPEHSRTTAGRRTCRCPGTPPGLLAGAPCPWAPPATTHVSFCLGDRMPPCAVVRRGVLSVPPQFQSVVWRIPRCWSLRFRLAPPPPSRTGRCRDLPPSPP